MFFRNVGVNQQTYNYHNSSTRTYTVLKPRFYHKSSTRHEHLRNLFRLYLVKIYQDFILRVWMEWSVTSSTLASRFHGSACFVLEGRVMAV